MPYFYGKLTLIQRFQAWVWKVLGLDTVIQQFEREFLDLWHEVDSENIHDVERDVDDLRDLVFALSDDIADATLREFFGPDVYASFGGEGYDPSFDEPLAMTEPLSPPDPVFMERLGLAAEPTQTDIDWDI